VKRVQKWRRKHPGYWKKKGHASGGRGIVDSQAVKSSQESRNARGAGVGTLQDVCLAQNPLFVGLLSLITGSTLQDDMASKIDDLVIRGRRILGLRPTEKHNSEIASDDGGTDIKKTVSSENSRGT
jgi:hypothetical protein